MFFIPLLAELGVELGGFKKSERGGLTCLTMSIFVQLICNDAILDDLDEESSGKLDETSTAIMMCLKEKGLMEKEHIYDYDLTHLVLYNAMNRPKYRSEKTFEKKFCFLINWDPSILLECGRGESLLYHYVCRLCTKADGRTPCGAFHRFGTIFELGVSHYPKELGFLFHRTTYQDGSFPHIQQITLKQFELNNLIPLTKYRDD